MSRLVSVRYRCPECDATHVRPEYIDGEEPEQTREGECYAPHPARGADFEGCGNEVELEAIAWREDRDGEWVSLVEDTELVTDGGQTLACPECGSTKNIFRRAPGRHNSTVDPNEDVWRCSDCGADFDEPARRDRQRKSGRRGLAGRLAAADKDDVSADQDDSTLVPDGGEIGAPAKGTRPQAARRLPDDTTESCVFECDRQADYQILWEYGVEFTCCRQCAQAARIYPEGGLVDADYAAAKARETTVETDGGPMATANPDAVVLETIGAHYARPVDGPIGAPIGDVVDDVLQTDSIGLQECCEALARLSRTGAIYQPSPTTIAQVTPDGGEIADTFDEFTDPQTDPERRCRRCGDVVARKYLHEGVCVGCRYREHAPTREPLTDGGRAPPDVDDVVGAPAGTTCELWPTPAGPCGEPAVVLYVYTHSADERPVTALACDEHAPAYPDNDTDTDLRTDGGHLERPDVEHGKQWYSLRAFQRDCLVAVSVYTDARPPSGREIQAYLERWYHDSVHHSQLYTNLDTLVEAGLLEKTTLDGRTNGYRLTAEGEAVLDRGAVHLQRAANGGENA